MDMQHIYNHWKLEVDQLKGLGGGVKEFMSIYFYKLHRNRDGINPDNQTTVEEAEITS